MPPFARRKKTPVGAGVLTTQCGLAAANNTVTLWYPNQNYAVNPFGLTRRWLEYSE